MRPETKMFKPYLVREGEQAALTAEDASEVHHHVRTAEKIQQELLAAGSAGMTVSELAGRTGLPRHQVCRGLQLLVETRLARKEETGEGGGHSARFFASSERRK